MVSKDLCRIPGFHGPGIPLLLLLAVWIPTALAVPAEAQYCTGPAGWAPGTATIPANPNCPGGFYCYPPELLGVTYETKDSCDPEAGLCTVRAVVPARFPGNQGNPYYGESYVKLFWYNSGGGLVDTCGSGFAPIATDDGLAWIGGGDFGCDDPEAMSGADTYTLKAVTCESAGCKVQTTTTVPLTPQALAAALCDPPPTPMNCGSGDASCSACLNGDGNGGTSVGGGGPGVGAPGTGPGASLVYQAGGTGNGAYPKPADWTVTLGRFWSHDYAERIVQDPDDSHVVLLTRWATYREFTDGDADDVYESASPSDEYRTLTQTAGGWELRDLDGTIDHFDTNGRWTQRVDRNGNAKVATYNASQQLESVAFPDGRSETFTYGAGGKLETITEVGTDGTTTRTWTYTWTGDDLTWIDRPDGTAWRFEYGEPLHPGYMTKLVLVGTDGTSERVERGFRYDAEGNVEAMWKGADDPADLAAVDVWLLSFDDPEQPTQATVTDPLGKTSVYTLGRDASSKPRLEALSASCPVCGIGPNSQMLYEDPAHPLRPTQETDGDGTVTRLTYDAYGQVISRIEDFGGVLERETGWTYHPTYPALVTEIRRPSVTGNPLDERVTSIVYDAAGNETTRTILGFENGTPFSYAIVTTPNAAGRVLSVDPPGYSTRDVTSFTYDPARGDLIPATRTDPLIGATTFVHDPFNRRTSVTGPNLTITETVYDELDRIRFVTSCGRVCDDGDDLVTENVYDVLGDLFQTILPEGNVIEYGYDTAGRMTTVERKADPLPTTHGERTYYELDGFGHRVREEQQSWDGSQWLTEAATEFHYSTRCYLDQQVEGAGSAEESVTEYAYDCDGDLERVWDANHPSAGQTAPASTVYAYDELNRLESTTQPWGGAGGGSVVTTYGYDVQDHLTSLTDGEGNTTTWTVSDRDLTTQEVSPVSGTTSFTYNEHGGLRSRTDARNVTVTQAVDGLDRVIFVDYPDNSLDVRHTYDDRRVPFSKGHLTRTLRDGKAVDYEYDAFGRMTKDGGLGYTYDKNGNRTQILYPYGVTSVTYSYDFADRQKRLTLTWPDASSTDLVTDASYYASGPLRSLALGNGQTETRLYDSRYHPQRITVTGPGGPLLDWQYTTDALGNPRAIADLLNSAGDRTYDYQDQQYYLTQGDGPWGALSWSYDRIGNRLTETRDGQPADVYGYELNGGGGNTAKLATVQLWGGGLRSYGYDPAGNQTSLDQDGDVALRSYDQAGRLSFLEHVPTGQKTELHYDGRSFLREAKDACTFCSPIVSVFPTYSSDGILQYKTQLGVDSNVRRFVFYFADRPVAALTEVLDLADAKKWIFLSTNHLGTPILAVDDLTQTKWAGGFEPFGEDYDGALAADVFLRFPGQWADHLWGSSFGTSGMYYNVHRWLDSGVGRYTRPDPLGTHSVDYGYYIRPDTASSGSQSYADSNPIRFVDPLGLVKFTGFSGLTGAQAVAAVAFVRNKLGQNPCCADRVQKNAGKRMLAYLDDTANELEIEYVPTLRPTKRSPRGRCGFSPVGTMVGFKEKIQIGGPATSCCLNRVSPIISLAAVVLHELGHSALGMPGEKRPDDLMLQCFGCQR